MLASSMLDKSLDLINATCESVRVLLCRPFFCLSKLFSKTVPLTKCDGLTHAGLSQVCITIGLAESNPLYINCENLCARHCLPSNWNRPYPSESVFPVHIQQESVFKTFDKKRISGSDFFLPISKLYIKRKMKAI